nr:transglycosylase SLT domain-containing protein [uncultured Ralstonia sp.]
MALKGKAVYRAVALAFAGVIGIGAVGPVAVAAQAKRQAPQGIPANPDDAFVELRNAARRNDVARSWELADSLSDYPIQSYVQYFRIKPQLFDASGYARTDAPEDEIRAFLQRYKGEAIADRLRNDWLLVLGKKRDWATFDAEYPNFVLKDDTQVECYALLSRAMKGGSAATGVAADARNTLADPKGYGEGCVDLIGYLAQSQQFTRADVAFAARLSLEQNLVTQASRIAAVLPEGDRVDNDTLANVTRMARNDPSQATAYLLAQSGGLSREEQGAGWGVIGQYAAKKQTPDALDAYRRQMTLGGDAYLSDDSQEWRVRTALRAGDWKMVRQAIETMRPTLRSRDPAWTYWYGRALKADNRNDEAKQQFQSIAGQFNFYGQLALEELGQRITVPPKTAVTDAEIDPIGRNHPGFARAKRLYDLNLRFEGNREWNWELRNMSDRELIAAAEYGRKLGLLDRAVNSADKTKTEHDFSLRFPTPFLNVVQRNADAVGLDIAWTYGLIRQESRFIMDARSLVGASGLMQVMPETAKRVAKKIGLPGFRPSQMSDIDTNVLLGTSYLSMILTDLDSSMTLATAGYNAGPGRPKRWRSTLTRPVEGAIFAETIPFNETRTYVKNVLSNATYYSALLSGHPQSLKDRLGKVAPEAVTPDDLP